MDHRLGKIIDMTLCIDSSRYRKADKLHGCRFFCSIGLQSIDRAHLDAAATMGATEAVTFRTVILPQTLPYSISGFFFALVLSFNEFIVMFFVSASAYATVTLQIFNSLRNGYTPTMAVAAVLFITVSIAVFSAVARWGDLPRLMGADQSRK